MILRRLARTYQVLTPRTSEALPDFQPTWCLRPAPGRGLTNRSTRTLPLRVNLFDKRSAVLLSFTLVASVATG